MENDRRLFSRRDGKTFREDFPEVVEEVRLFINSLPFRIKLLLPEVEDYIEAIEAVHQATKEGSDFDIIVDKALEFIPGEKDSEVYNTARQLISEFAVKLMYMLEKIKENVYQQPEQVLKDSVSYEKRAAATDLIRKFNHDKLKTNEIALAIETVLYYKSA